MTDDDFHTMTAEIPGGLTLRLTWREMQGASALVERTWCPTRPDILPAGIVADLVEGLAEYLEANGWAGAPTEHVAKQFLGLRPSPEEMTP